MSSPFWLSSAQSILCVATCIIHEGGLLSPRACCSFERIMGFDRAPCCAELLDISVVITIPFLITYPWWLLSAAAEEMPCPLTQRQAGSLPPLPQSLRCSLPEGLLPLPACVSPFPVLWFLSHAPLRNELPPLWFLGWCSKGPKDGESRSLSLCAAWHLLSAVCIHLGRRQLSPKITTCSKSSGEK